MKGNPLIPYAVTALIGILLMIGMSFYGLNVADRIAAGEGGEEQAVAENPEDIVKGTCAGCHGQNLEGASGPKLSDIGSRLSADEIHGVIANGQGSMPGGLVQGDAAQKVADWLAEKK